eukprot:RCo052266
MEDLATPPLSSSLSLRCYFPPTPQRTCCLWMCLRPTPAHLTPTQFPCTCAFLWLFFPPTNLQTHLSFSLSLTVALFFGSELELQPSPSYWLHWHSIGSSEDRTFPFHKHENRSERERPAILRQTWPAGRIFILLQALPVMPTHVRTSPYLI